MLVFLAQRHCPFLKCSHYLNRVPSVQAYCHRSEQPCLHYGNTSSKSEKPTVKKLKLEQQYWVVHTHDIHYSRAHRISKKACQSCKQINVLLSLISSCLGDTWEASSIRILLLEPHPIILDGRKHAAPTSQQIDQTTEVQYHASRT